MQQFGVFSCAKHRLSRIILQAYWGALSFKDPISEQSTILYETREECLPLHAGIIRQCCVLPQLHEPT